jgi:hypothetical protein
MADDVTNGELHRLLVSLGLVLTEIKGDVKAQNGTVADLKTRVALLEDRGTRDNSARASGIGGIAAAAAALIWQYFSK